MSVDYTAYIGLGWVIDEALYSAMQDAAGDQWGDVEDFFHHINMYSSDTDIFFGDFIYGVDAGDYELLTNLLEEVDINSFCQKYNEVLKICGQDPDRWVAKTFLINRIW